MSAPLLVVDDAAGVSVILELYSDADLVTVAAPPAVRARSEPPRAYAVELDDLDPRDLEAVYFRTISKIPLLTRDDEWRLGLRARRGDTEAQRQIVEGNLRLVVKIAHDYMGRGLSLLDLISEGNIGLTAASVRYDPIKGAGAKFSTYAAWWIKQSIRRALANMSRTIRLPVHQSARVGRLRGAEFRLVERLGREPTNTEVAEEMGLTVEKVAHLRSISVRPLSLDAPVGDGGDSATWGDLVADELIEDPATRYGRESLVGDLFRWMDCLDAREREIISLRFGIGRGARTLEEVGAMLKVTRERIRQIQNIALRKLRKLAKKDIR